MILDGNSCRVSILNMVNDVSDLRRLSPAMKFDWMFWIALLTFLLFFSLVRYQKKVSNIIDDVLEWSPKLAISGMIEKHTGADITEESNYTSRAASSHVPPPSTKGPDMDADGDTEANLDETQDNEYADDTRSSEA